MFQMLQAGSKMSGFVHIPALHSQTEPQFEGKPKMSDEEALSGLTQILRFLTDLS